MNSGVIRRYCWKICRPFLFLLTVIAAAFGASGTASSDIEGTPKFVEYVSPGKYFKCLLPEGWSRYEAPDASRDATKVYGMEVYQRRSEHKVAISVKYYAGDNRLHKSAEQFIKVHSRPVFGGPEQEGERYGPVKEIPFKGIQAKTFERTLYEFEDHVRDQASGRYAEPISPRKFPMVERYIVVPAQKGFYVLRYKAPPDAERELEGIFQRVLESFEMSMK